MHFLQQEKTLQIHVCFLWMIACYVFTKAVTHMRSTRTLCAPQKYSPRTGWYTGWRTGWYTYALYKISFGETFKALFSYALSSNTQQQSHRTCRALDKNFPFLAHTRWDARRQRHVGIQLKYSRDTVMEIMEFDKHMKHLSTVKHVLKGKIVRALIIIICPVSSYSLSGHLPFSLTPINTHTIPQLFVCTFSIRRLSTTLSSQKIITVWYVPKLTTTNTITHRPYSYFAHHHTSHVCTGTSPRQPQLSLIAEGLSGYGRNHRQRAIARHQGPHPRQPHPPLLCSSGRSPP